MVGRQGRFRSSLKETNREDDREDGRPYSSVVTESQAPRSQQGCSCRSSRVVENSFKVTELEALFEQMRRLIMQNPGRSWKLPVISLKHSIQSRLELPRTEIETDQLLIEICSELDRIINENDTTEQSQNRNESNHGD